MMGSWTKTSSGSPVDKIEKQLSSSMMAIWWAGLAARKSNNLAAAQSDACHF
jgi:hypothetical protein